MSVPEWVAEFFALIGVFCLALACLRSGSRAIRRIGMWLVPCTICLALWFWTGLWYVTALGMAAWFTLPVFHAAVVSRRLRISPRRSLTPGPLDIEEFPEIRPVSDDLRDLGYVRDSDCWLRPSPLDQGFRLFYHPESNTSTALAIVRQGAFAMSYLILANEDCHGAVWITWDYPLAYGMKMPPHFKIHRCLDADSIEDLHQRHLDFLKINEVEIAPKPTVSNARDLYDRIFSETLIHNIREGLLQDRGPEDQAIRYSWRGTLFIAWQVFLETIVPA